MFPYFFFPTFHLGPVVIQTWGFFVSLGFLTAIILIYFFAPKKGLDKNEMLDLAFWVMIGGIAGARLFHVFIYSWKYYQNHLNEILRLDFGGLSSIGGFIGALLMLQLFFRKQAKKQKTWNANVRWQCADIIMLATFLGWAIGRLGCFFVHDHPGRLTSFIGGVAYPGGARYDLGLYESILALVIFFILVTLRKKLTRTPGLLTAVGMILYSIPRFFLDFLRATDLPISDVRYFGLTPAQYACIIIFSFGVYLIVALMRKSKHDSAIKS